MRRRACCALFSYLLLAAAPASQLKTIVTVRTTPFCSAIGRHFNAAVVPMLANDRDFDRVDTQLVDLNDVFHHADYQIRYSGVRVHLMKSIGAIRSSLPEIQSQINGLRDGEKLTQDPQEAAQLHQVAEKLQLAYNKQYQLATDVAGIVQTMMSYQPPADLDVMQGELAEQSMPQDMRDVKSYLRFDGQRDVIDRSENAAADAAIDLVSKHCSSLK